MQKRTLAACLAPAWLAVALLGCGAQPPAHAPAVVRPAPGRYRSVGCERQVDTSGGARFLLRDLRIDASGAWTMRAGAFADATCRAPLLGLVVGGDSGAMSPDGSIDFHRREVRITPISEAARARLVGCGEVSLRQAVDATSSGCGIVPSVSACPTEHDRLEVSEDGIRLGDRSGNLCDARPTTFGAPLARHPEMGNAHVVDLSHPLDASFPFIPHPTTFSFRLEPLATIERDGVAANRWHVHEHIGTQVDAPSHFVEGGRDLAGIAASDLLAPLVVIDLRDRARNDADAALGIDDVLAWEGAHGPVPIGAAVFLRTGWDARVADPPSVINRGADGLMHFPGFSADAAAFLADARRATGIGVDTLSIDPGRDRSFETHRTWLGRGGWAAEMVANLGDVPPAGAVVIVGAPRVAGATGGPARILAVW
jgi:kynurenine formamidase